MLLGSKMILKFFILSAICKSLSYCISQLGDGLNRWNQKRIIILFECRCVSQPPAGCSRTLYVSGQCKVIDRVTTTYHRNLDKFNTMIRMDVTSLRLNWPPDSCLRYHQANQFCWIESELTRFESPCEGDSFTQSAQPNQSNGTRVNKPAVDLDGHVKLVSLDQPLICVLSQNKIE